MNAHMNMMNNHMNVMNNHINAVNNMMYNQMNVMNEHMNVMNNHMSVMNNHMNVMNNHINNMNNQNMGNNPNWMNYQNMENIPNMMNNQNMGNNPNWMNYQNMGNNPNMMNNQNMGNNPNWMNYQNMENNPNMMNNQNMRNNNNEADNNNRFEDVYPYINGNKIMIILEGLNNKRVYILIPTSLKNNELYYTARKFRKKILDNYFSKIKLYHNNILLNDDDTLIEYIYNGDTICMRNSISLSYQNNFQNNQNSPFINIIFKFYDNINKPFCRVFPINISIRQMFIIIFEQFFEENERNFFYFVYNGSIINTEDNTLLSNFVSFHNNQNIEIRYYFNLLEDFPGKIFNVNIQNNRGLILNLKVGTLEQIKSFRRRINQEIENLRYSIINNPILNPGEIELNEDDERTFSSIGIRDDCICRVELLEI